MASEAVLGALLGGAIGGAAAMGGAWLQSRLATAAASASEHRDRLERAAARYFQAVATLARAPPDDPASEEARSALAEAKMSLVVLGDYGHVIPLCILESYSHLGKDPRARGAFMDLIGAIRFELNQKAEALDRETVEHILFGDRPDIAEQWLVPLDD